MKNFIFKLIIIFTVITNSLIWAQNDTTQITVDVLSIKSIQFVASAPTLTLDTQDGTTGNYTTATNIQAGSLELAHNSATNQKVTVEAAVNTTPANDITLTVQIGTQPVQTLVNNGTIETASDAWTGIAAGSYIKDLTWAADASLAGTPVNTYIWDVTFTMMDDV